MAEILIVDDDSHVREVLTEFVRSLGHRVMAAETLSEGLELVGLGNFDLVLLDVNLPDGSGLERIPDFKGAPSCPEVIIVTAEGSTDGARMAIEHEAWDYILKPFSRDQIVLNIKRVLAFRAAEKTFQSSAGEGFNRSAIIGTSAKLSSCLDQAARCAKSDASVLITGETGTGKEMFANTIHENSNQSRNGFIVVDCAALPEQLVESVLFGNLKGAFTGADAAREGLVKKADGGTLFLDEIGELPMPIQKKFLRVLQERRFKPVGGTKEITSRFRLICATNRNLEDMTRQNQFRSDLLYRIQTIHIHLPPLRACREDIKPLVLHYIHSLCEHHRMETKGFESEFLDCLESYDWPGNIRELINCLEKAVLANVESPMLFPNYLPPHIRLHQIESSLQARMKTGFETAPQTTAEDSVSINLPRSMLNPIKPLKQVKNYMAGETEKIYLTQLMKLCQGDLEKAAALASISKSRIYSLLRTYGISAGK